MNTQQDDVVIIGHIGGAYGVKGWVHVVSYTDPPENLLEYRPWSLQPSTDQHSDTVQAGSWRAIDCAAVKAHGDGFVATFEGVSDRERAQALKGYRIGVDAESLPAIDEDEFYWRDLIGQTVVDQRGEVLGAVERLIETGARDVLVIVGQDEARKETLIPFVDQFVTDVDLEKQTIRVDWEDAWEDEA